MPIVAAAVIGAGASIYGASQQAKAAQSAANASKKASDQSIQLQRDIYNQNRADQEPWRQAGLTALNTLANPLANFQASPDYQFRMSQGLNAVNQNRATAGLLNSGSALKGLNDYAQNTAAGEFGSWWNRQAGLAGIGQDANRANATSGANYADSTQNALMANAGNQMQSSYYRANANAQGVGNALGAVSWGLQNWTPGGSGASNPLAHAGGYSAAPVFPNIWRG